jgi:hypothetical protein
MLDLLLLQIVFVVGLEGGAVDAAAVVGVPAEIRILFPLDSAVLFEQFHVYSVLGD